MYESMLKSEEMDILFEAILKLKTEDECYMFFEDICTISELKSIAQRMKVAMLLEEKHTCHDISVATGASTALRCISFKLPKSISLCLPVVLKPFRTRPCRTAGIY